MYKNGYIFIQHVLPTSGWLHMVFYIMLDPYVVRTFWVVFYICIADLGMTLQDLLLKILKRQECYFKIHMEI